MHWTQKVSSSARSALSLILFVSYAKEKQRRVDEEEQRRVALEAQLRHAKPVAKDDVAVRDKTRQKLSARNGNC